MYEHNRILKTYPKQSSQDARDKESGYLDFLELAMPGPFQENEIFQLDVDVKGEGVLNNYFYGRTGYLKVKKIETSQGHIFTGGDGRNVITLTDDYKHYIATFTLGNDGDGSVMKALLFRVSAGNMAYIKNIEFKKIYPTEEEVVSENNNKTLYAIWKANS